jgi:hypothetical protein
MSERERQANLGLQSLDEAHLLGRITRNEYRLRRRHLLAGLADADAATAKRDTVRRATPAGGLQDSRAGEAARRERASTAEESAASRARAGFYWRHLVVSAGVLGVLGLGLALFYWLVLRAP